MSTIANEPMAKPLSNETLEVVASDLGIPTHSVWAILSVESKTCGFLPDRRPQILFERHKFHQATHGRHDKHQDISNQNPGGYLLGAKEWTRFEKASALDAGCAIFATSWGLPQIMGFNFHLCGFNMIADLASEFMLGEDQHILALGMFLRSNRALVTAIQRKSWATVARIYNGRDYAKNEYDTRLARADAAMKIAEPNLTIRAAQMGLMFLGYNPGPVDGFSGRKTRGATLAWQVDNGRKEDEGNLTPETVYGIRDAAWPKTTFCPF